MFERFTDRSRRVVVLAQEEARMLGHDYIGTEHLLLGLIHEGTGVAATVLGSAGVTIEAARAVVQEEVAGSADNPPTGHMPFTSRARKVLDLSLREALESQQRYVSTEHMLLGLIREGTGTGVLVLERLAGPLPALRERVIIGAAEAPAEPAGEGEGADSAMAAPRGFMRAARARSQSITEFRALLNSLDRRLANVERHLGLSAVDPAASLAERIGTVERHLGVSAEESSGPGMPGEPGQSPMADG